MKMILLISRSYKPSFSCKVTVDPRGNLLFIEEISIRKEAEGLSHQLGQYRALNMIRVGFWCIYFLINTSSRYSGRLAAVFSRDSNYEQSYPPIRRSLLKRLLMLEHTIHRNILVLLLSPCSCGEVFPPPPPGMN